VIAITAMVLTAGTLRDAEEGISSRETQLPYKRCFFTTELNETTEKGFNQGFTAFVIPGPDPESSICNFCKGDVFHHRVTEGTEKG